MDRFHPSMSTAPEPSSPLLWPAPSSFTAFATSSTTISYMTRNRWVAQNTIEILSIRTSKSSRCQWHLHACTERIIWLIVRSSLLMPIDPRFQNAEVFIRYHPFRPNTLGVFSLEEGAALVDVSPAQPKLPNQSSRFKPLPGEAHVCKPCAILWGTTETLVTIANDGRIVYYGKKRSVDRT